MKVNPPAGATAHLEARGELVGLYGEPHRLERPLSHAKRVSVDGQVEVAVRAGRFTAECVDSPAPREPLADAHTLEGIEDMDHLAGSHET